MRANLEQSDRGLDYPFVHGSEKTVCCSGELPAHKGVLPYDKNFAAMTYNTKLVDYGQQIDF